MNKVYLLNVLAALLTGSNTYADPLRITFTVDFSLETQLHGAGTLQCSHDTGELKSFCHSKGFDSCFTFGKGDSAYFVSCLGDSTQAEAVVLKKTDSKGSCDTHNKEYENALAGLDDTKEILNSEGSSVIEINKYDGPDPLSHFRELADQIGLKVNRAKQKTEDLNVLASCAFLKKDLLLARKYSKSEIEQYPIGKYKNLKFRIFSAPFVPGKSFLENLPTEARRTIRSGLDDFLDQTEVNQDFIYLYKTIPKSHLCDIRKTGLDSKFGGVGGASETNQFDGATEHDRGRMFFASTIASALSFGSNDSKLLLVKIPLNHTLSLNLTCNWGEWFSAGTVIPVNNIYVESAVDDSHKESRHGRNFVPLSSALLSGECSAL